MRASSAGSSLGVDEGQPARCWWPSLSSNGRATAARECRSSLTLPLKRSVSSSWRTSRPVRWSSATVWGPIQPPVGGHRHTPFNVRASGLPAHVPLPGVHRVAALAKRWLLGTHQGAVEADHRQAYLNEFCFRFNRRHSRARGLLFYRLMHLAVGAPPRTYRHLVVNPQPKRRRPIAPQGPRPQPGTLALPPAGRPWRQDSTGVSQGPSDGYPDSQKSWPRPKTATEWARAG